MNVGISRRRFFAALATLGASRSLAAIGIQRSTGQQRIIDVHHHVLPPVYLREARDQFLVQGYGGVPPTASGWTPENAVEQMDMNGVETAIVSISTPGIWFGHPQAARSLARKCNEYAAQLCRDRPRRFGFFAVAPLPDTSGSIDEIAYALDVLKADGIGLMTSYGSRWPGDPAFAAVFDELNRRKSTVYIHPTVPNCCRNLSLNVPLAVTEIPNDTTRAVLSFLASGSFARLRDVRFIFAHAGGTIPMLAGRIAQWGIAQKEPHDVESELKRLYYDIANSATRPSMAALMALVPTSQILFGSDYPFVPIEVTLKELMDLDLSDTDLKAIRSDNALALLPRFR